MWMWQLEKLPMLLDAICWLIKYVPVTVAYLRKLLFFNTSGCVFCVILCFVSTFRGKKFVNRSSSHKMSNNQASIKKREKSPHHLQLIIEMCLFFNFESIEWMQWPKLHGQCIKQVEKKKIIGKQKYLPIKTFGVSKYTKNKHCTHSVLKTYFRSFFAVLEKYVQRAEFLYDRLVRVWVLIFPFFAITNPEDLQTVLSSRKHTDKIFFYKLLHNFLGNGLITSSGEKNWKFVLDFNQISLNDTITNMFSMKFIDPNKQSSWTRTNKIMGWRERDILRTEATNLPL